MENNETIATLKAVLQVLQELIDKLERPPALEVFAVEEIKGQTKVGG